MNAHLPPVLRDLALPVIGAPMFTVSYPALALAQCKAGIVGALPALNARTPALLNTWLTQMMQDLAAHRHAHPGAKTGPLAVNLIVHDSNQRLAQDLDTCVRHRVPILITSLRAPVRTVIDAVHGYGGIVLHDVIHLRHARKALDAGVDGLVLVATGAGGHAGRLSPFALLGEVRAAYAGPLALSGAITTGRDVLAAQAMGADFAYMGTRFIASQESNASDAYKAALLDAAAADIVYTPYFTGVHGNYLRASIAAVGLDPDALGAADGPAPAFAAGGANRKFKAWKDIWGAGQGVGQIHDLPATADIVARLAQEYAAARARLALG